MRVHRPALHPGQRPVRRVDHLQQAGVAEPRDLNNPVVRLSHGRAQSNSYWPPMRRREIRAGVIVEMTTIFQKIQPIPLNDKQRQCSECRNYCASAGRLALACADYTLVARDS